MAPLPCTKAAGGLWAQGGGRYPRLRQAQRPGGGTGREPRGGLAPFTASGGGGRFRRAPGAAARGRGPLGFTLVLVDAAVGIMQLTVKALQGRECSLQVPEDELVSTLKHLVSDKLNVPVRQQRLLFKGKALTDEKRLSDYNIGPNSKLNLVVKPLEKVLLEEGSAHRLVDSPPPPLWQLISKVLARHFSVADTSRVLEQLQRDYDRSLSRLTLDDIERLASRFLHPEVTESMEKGFSK